MNIGFCKCKICMPKDVNPNTTFYSYYFFPRAPRSDFAVLFLSTFQPAFLQLVH